MELSSPNIKRIIIFSLKRIFFIFLEINTALFSPSSKKNKTHPEKNFSCFRKRKPTPKCLIFSQTKAFFIYFEKRKRDFLIFQDALQKLYETKK